MSSLQGNPALVEQPEVRGYDAGTGNFSQRSWKGTREACYAGTADLAGADHWEISGDGAVYTLTARFATDTSDGNTEVPVREERLHWNEVQQKLEASPEFSSLNDRQIAFVRDNLDVVGDVASAEIEAEILIECGQVGVDLWILLRSGVEAVPVYQPVVIVTDTASAAYPWNIGFGNAGLIFTTAGMIADADLVSGWKANLPNDSAPTGFMYGWRKKPPEITTVSSNRTQLVQEYEYGLWHLLLYGSA